MNKEYKTLFAIISLSTLITLTGCSTPKLPGADKSVELATTQQAIGCKHIKHNLLSSCNGIGAPEQYRNTKKKMLNDVLTSGGNAYIIHELSSGTGRCGSADYDVYICPEGYNQASYIRLDSSKNGTISTEDYSKKSIEDRLEKINILYKKEILTEKEYLKKREEIINNL